MADRPTVDQLKQQQQQAPVIDGSRRQARIFSAVMNAILQGIYDVKRLDDQGRAFIIEDDFHIYFGAATLFGQIIPTTSTEYKVDHAETGNLSPTMKTMISDMADVTAGIYKPRRIPEAETQGADGGGAAEGSDDTAETERQPAAA